MELQELYDLMARFSASGLSELEWKKQGEEIVLRRAVPAGQADPAPAVSAQNNQQIVAAIAVAIAEEMGTDVSHIRIHSIKRV